MRKPTAMISSVSSPDMPGLEAFGKFKAIILLEYVLNMPGWETLRELNHVAVLCLKAIRLPEYASQIPG